MNPWHELGLTEDADEDEIRRAYRRLAAEHHPDRNPDDAQAAERFQRVRQAYDMLRQQPTPATNQPWPDVVYGSPSGTYQPPYEGPWPSQGDRSGGGFGPGVRVRFVAPPQLQALVVRLRRVLALVLVLGLAGIIALGHGLRGEPWAELLWPHQLVWGLATGLVAVGGAFFGWLFAVFILGFRLGTLAFWALLALQVLR